MDTNNQKGMSLPELLVVTGIVSIISVAMTTLFAHSIKLQNNLDARSEAGIVLWEIKTLFGSESKCDDFLGSSDSILEFRANQKDEHIVLDHVSFKSGEKFLEVGELALGSRLYIHGLEINNFINISGDTYTADLKIDFVTKKVDKDGKTIDGRSVVGSKYLTRLVPLVLDTQKSGGNQEIVGCLSTDDDDDEDDFLPCGAQPYDPADLNGWTDGGCNEYVSYDFEDKKDCTDAGGKAKNIYAFDKSLHPKTNPGVVDFVCVDLHVGNPSQCLIEKSTPNGCTDTVQSCGYSCDRGKWKAKACGSVEIDNGSC